RNPYTGGDGRQQIRRTAHRFDEAVAAKDNAISLGCKRLGRIGQKRIVPTGHDSATQGGQAAAVVVRFHEASRGLNRLWPRNAPVAGGYLKITNAGTAPDRLVGGSTEVAKRFEIHEMKMDGGVMKMRELKDGVEIPPGATVELKPGSYHIMIMNLSRPLTKGERVKGSLTFEKAGKVDVEFAVEALGGNAAGTAKDHGH